VRVSDDLTLSCNARFTCSYQHTGVIAITAPAGLTYSSGSGVFLSQLFVEAPEPDACALMLTGFAAAGSAIRRGRRRCATV
jgi:hypothetical protein